MRCQATTQDGEQCSRKATEGDYCTQHANMKTNDVSKVDRHNLVAPGSQYGGERDLYEVLGYPDSLDPSDYFNKYQRQDLARRVVSAPAHKTWGQASRNSREGQRR